MHTRVTAENVGILFMVHGYYADWPVKVQTKKDQGKTAKIKSKFKNLS